MKDGGRALGRALDFGGGWVPYEDAMSLRDYFMAHAPFTLSDAALVCGFTTAQLANDQNRAVVISVLALMRRKYADEMLKEREKKK